MVPSGVNEMKLQEAGFMFNMEKNVWYHQGTEFGRRKAENEEKSVEKLVSYLEVSICIFRCESNSIVSVVCPLAHNTSSINYSTLIIN